MGVPLMLEGFLHHKKEEKDYLCALVVSEDRIDAALWEATKDGKVEVLKTSQKTFEGEWENAIDAADGAISELEPSLPKGTELKKVVFGLFPERISEDHIKETYLKQLKQLTTALSLTPMGFVELPIAISHLLQKDEGTQQTVILVGIESKHLTVSLFKIGKLIRSTTSDRGETVAGDIEKTLATFLDVEVLPSRILLYGTVAELEKIKTDLLNYPWQKKANFLHFPKIEVLKEDFAVRAVAVASSTEITPTAAEEAEAPVPSDAATGQSEEVASIAEDLGFVKDEEEIAVERPLAAPVVSESARTVVADVQNVEPVEPSQLRPKSSPLAFLKNLIPKNMAFTFRVPRFGRMRLLAIVGLVVLVLFGLVGGSVWALPRATVKLLVSPQYLDKTENIVVKIDATEVDVEGKVLPGQEVSAEVTGSKTVAATGKKTVGDRARGEVTIYNKTLNSKTFRKGQVLSVGKLNFTLDDETQVASASESVGSLTYGSTKAKVTASDIGAASNVSSSTEFTFADLPASSYTARNDTALAGGSSREISVVSREDQNAVRQEALAELKTKAETDLQAQLPATQKLLADSGESKVTKEAFSKEVGEEASELTVDMAVTISALAYNQEDFFALLDRIVTDSVPENFEYKKEDAVIDVEEPQVESDGSRVFASHIKVALLPKVETQDLAKKLAGRTVDEATDFLRGQSGVSGVEFDLKSPLSFLGNQLPLNSANISFQVEAL